MRAWLLELTVTDHAKAHALRRRLAAETPALAAHERGNLAQLEGVLADAIAADLGAQPDALAPHLAAAAALATLEALGRFHDGREQPREEIIAILDEALAFLDGGLRALRRSGARQSAD